MKLIFKMIYLLDFSISELLIKIYSLFFFFFFQRNVESDSCDSPRPTRQATTREASSQPKNKASSPKNEYQRHSLKPIPVCLHTPTCLYTPHQLYCIEIFPGIILAVVSEVRSYTFLLFSSSYFTSSILFYKFLMGIMLELNNSGLLLNILLKLFFISTKIFEQIRTFGKFSVFF